MQSSQKNPKCSWLQTGGNEIRMHSLIPQKRNKRQKFLNGKYQIFFRNFSHEYNMLKDGERLCSYHMLMRLMRQYGLRSRKRPPVSDHLGLTFWGVAYGRFNCIWVTDQACSVKMAGYLPSSYFCQFMDLDSILIH